MNKEVFAVISDGVTVGWPTCGVPKCTVDLHSPKDTFCPVHLKMTGICRVVGCEVNVEEGSKACGDPEHQAAEQNYVETGTAAFQLKKRFEQSRQVNDMSNTIWQEGEELDTGSEAVFEAVVGDDKGKSKKLRAQFGQKCTHNEQLIIAPCGIILARQTFHHSEAFSLVAVRESFFHFTCLSNSLLM